jgi:hypothetical protein
LPEALMDVVERPRCLPEQINDFLVCRTREI